MQEAADLSPANRALVCLHAHDLAAVDAETHVAAWQDYSVLGRGVAHHTLPLALVCEVGSSVINAVDVVEVHNLVIVEQLLLEILEAEVVGPVLLEASICKLDISSALSIIILWVHCLNCDDNRVKVILMLEQIFSAAAFSSIRTLVVQGCVDYEQLRRELLL